jgi:hypothetical protein
MSDAERLNQYLRSGLKSVDGWLAHIDAEIFRTILTEQVDSLDVHGGCAEIGVHHGKSFIALCLALRSDEKAYCIDVFSDQHLNKDLSGRGNRAVFEHNLSKFNVNLSSTIINQASSMDVAANIIRDAVGSVRFFSIDGGHWLEIVRSDLQLAESAICEGGVIALDDFHRAEWPDVSAGYFAWYSTKKDDIVPFAIGFNKLYLCRAEYLEKYQSVLEKNQYLSSFITTYAVIQGIRVPVYAEYMIPELPVRRGVMSFLKVFHPRTYRTILAAELQVKKARSSVKRLVKPSSSSPASP